MGLVQEFGKGLVEEDDEGFTVRLDVRAANALYRDGMLELRLPKPAAARRAQVSEETVAQHQACR